MKERYAVNHKTVSPGVTFTRNSQNLANARFCI